jgi:hypothetical protein
VYRFWSTIALGLASLTPGKTTSLAFAVGNRGDHQGKVSLRFPFNAPGYLIEPVAAQNGTTFDVVRCPIADYFRGHTNGRQATDARCPLPSTTEIRQGDSYVSFAPKQQIASPVDHFVGCGKKGASEP